MAGYGGGGDGWSGPRDFGPADYGPASGATIDTRSPFRVEASFPVDSGGSGLVASVSMRLTQAGRALGFSVASYSYGGSNGFVELTSALKAGMTPVCGFTAA